MINYPFRKRFEAIFLILAFIVSSCASHKVVESNPSDIQSSVNIGDTVYITTNDNREIEFKVIAINSIAIIGEYEAIPYGDIQTIEIKTVGTGGKIFGKIMLGILLGLLGSIGPSYY